MKKVETSLCNNWGRKRIYIILFVVSFFILLSGCSSEDSHTSVSEEAFVNDVIACFQENFIDYDLGTPLCELISHTQDSNLKTDIAEYRVTAKNDVMTLDCSIEVEYLLKDKTWVLSESCMTDWSYQIISSTVTESDAKAAFLLDASERRAIYTDCSLIADNTDLDTGIASYSFSATKEDGFMTSTDQIVVVYSFSPETKWELSYINVEEGEMTWSIEGEWTYHNSDSDMKLIIHQVTDNEIKFEYDFDYSCPAKGYLSYYMSSSHYTSSRVETRTIHTENDGSIHFYLLDQPGDGPSIYISKDLGVTFDGVWPGKANRFVFEYENGGYARTAENGGWEDIVNILDIPAIKILSSDPVWGITESDYGGMRHNNVFTRRAEDGVIPVFDLYSQYNYISGTLFLGSGAEVGKAAPFRIYGDGILLYEYDAAEFSATDYVKHFMVNITGVRELSLEISDTVTPIRGLNGVVHTYNMNVCEIVLSQEPLFRGYDYYSANGNEPYSWITDDTTLFKGLSYFKSMTEVQPYIALVAFDETMFDLNSNFDYELDTNKANQYCQNLCNELGFDDTGKYVILAYFAEENDSATRMEGGYYLYWTAGAANIMGENTTLFWDCLFDYPYSTFAEQFSNGFTLFADKV